MMIFFKHFFFFFGFCLCVINVSAWRERKRGEGRGGGVWELLQFEIDSNCFLFLNKIIFDNSIVSIREGEFEP